MAQDLPDDVWSQLAETWLDQEDLLNMSLTSRRMHRLVVPELCRCLEFNITHAEPLMVKLISLIMRARFLFNSPELLRHTHIFTFVENADTVDSMARHLALHEGLGSSSSRRDAENLLAVFHDAIYRLIFRIPGLREIRIGNAVMTPLCYAAISSRPFLTSLRLEPSRSPDITYVTPALPYSLRLRDFACYYHTWTGNDRPTDPYFADILDHFILDLEKLAMSSNLFPFVVSRIPLHCTLSLRSLSVRFPIYSLDGLEAATLLQILRACPQLRNLDFGGDFPDVDSTQFLPPPNLPNLSTFSGPPRLLQILYEGTNLVKIDIHDYGYIQVQSLTQIIRSPPTHLRELSMGFVGFSQPHELLTFILSLTVFRNLERLYIAYEHGMSWKDHVSSQDSHSTIKDLLRQLACLRFLDIFTWSSNVDGYDIGCPISKQGEPDNRGHPSLKKIRVDFICGWWSWDSRTGWEER